MYQKKSRNQPTNNWLIQDKTTSARQQTTDQLMEDFNTQNETSIFNTVCKRRSQQLLNSM
jgi:hypothetical protein